jgi:hypothetical protein
VPGYSAAANAVGGLLGAGPEAAASVGGDVAGEVLSGLEDTLGEKAVPILLNIGLVGGGAALVYFGIARMVGVAHPVATPISKAAAAA